MYWGNFPVNFNVSISTANGVVSTDAALQAQTIADLATYPNINACQGAADGLPVCNNTTNLAAYDLARWWAYSVSKQLPNPTVTVSCPPSPVGNPAPVSCTVVINWTEKSVAMNVNEAAASQAAQQAADTEPKRAAGLHAVRRAMNTYPTLSLRPAARQQGFTLVELMVTVAIALFLLGGLVTIVQNVRIANQNQTRLAQLQDEQRFAMTVITDAVQSGGYFADATTQSNALLPATANPAPTAAYQAGWVFAGSHTVGAADNAALDTIATRFQTAAIYSGGPVQGPILCDGTDTSQQVRRHLVDPVLDPGDRRGLDADVHGERHRRGTRIGGRARAAGLERRRHGHLLRRKARQHRRRLQRRYLRHLGHDVPARRRRRLRQRERGTGRADLRESACRAAQSAGHDNHGARHRSDEPRRTAHMTLNRPAQARQRGVALVTSLLLLVIITILALSMFRSFGTQEKIAGNLREKERALHAATSAQQYAEWWLTLNNNTANGSIACNGVVAATPTTGQICNQTPQQQLGGIAAMMQPANWTSQVTYTPLGMVLLGQPLQPGNPPYFATPAFWITDRGVAADGSGEAYQIDAYGYGSAANTVAVVESAYEILQGVVNRGGL